MYVCTYYTVHTHVWNVLTNVGLLMLRTSAESVFTRSIHCTCIHTYTYVYISEHCTVACSNIHCFQACPSPSLHPHRGLSLSLKLTLLEAPTSDCRGAWTRYICQIHWSPECFSLSTGAVCTYVRIYVCTYIVYIVCGGIVYSSIRTCSTYIYIYVCTHMHAHLCHDTICMQCTSKAHKVVCEVWVLRVLSGPVSKYVCIRAASHSCLPHSCVATVMRICIPSIVRTSCAVQMQCDAVSLEGKVQELQEENKRLALKGKEGHLRSMAERDGEVNELHQRLERKTEALTQLKVRTHISIHVLCVHACMQAITCLHVHVYIQ